MARHYASKRREHITKHDREVDRHNLEDGHKRRMAHDPAHYERNERPKNTDDMQRSSRSPMSGMRRAMEPNNPKGSFIEEDWNEPALLKRGVHEFDVTYHANKHKAGRLGDLYEQVDKTTKEDQEAFDTLTDPKNW